MASRTKQVDSHSSRGLSRRGGRDQETESQGLSILEEESREVEVGVVDATVDSRMVESSKQPLLFADRYSEYLQFQEFMAAQRAAPRGEFDPLEEPRTTQSIMDPGSMVAMAQIKPPTLEGLKIAHIKSFRLAYRRYASKVPVQSWIRLPGQLVLEEHLVSIAAINDMKDVQSLQCLEADQFFLCLCRLHNASMTIQWCRLLEQIRMTSTSWSLEDFLEYRENFMFQMLLAGTAYQPSVKEVIRIFIKGLQPQSLQLEMRRREGESLEA